MRVELLNLDDAVTLMEHHWNLGGDVAGFAPSEQSDAQADEQRTDYCQYRHPSIPDVSLVVGHSQSTLSLCDYVKQSQCKCPRLGFVLASKSHPLGGKKHLAS